MRRRLHERGPDQGDPHGHEERHAGGGGHGGRHRSRAGPEVGRMIPDNETRTFQTSIIQNRMTYLDVIIPVSNALFSNLFLFRNPNQVGEPVRVRVQVEVQLGVERAEGQPERAPGHDPVGTVGWNRVLGNVLRARARNGALDITARARRPPGR